MQVQGDIQLYAVDLKLGEVEWEGESSGFLLNWILDVFRYDSI